MSARKRTQPRRKEGWPARNMGGLRKESGKLYINCRGSSKEDLSDRLRHKPKRVCKALRDRYNSRLYK